MAIVLSRVPALGAAARALAAFACAAFVCVALRTPWPARRSVAMAPALAALVAACAGFVARSGLDLPRPTYAAMGLRVQDVRSYRGVAVEDGVSLASGGVMHRIALRSVGSAGEAGSARAAGTVRLIASGGAPTFAGQTVAVRGSLERAEAFSNDDYVARAKGADVRPGEIRSFLLRARHRVRVGLEERVRQMGYPVSAFFLAMFIGDRAGVSEELATLFRDAGALHVLALSGTHLVLVFGLAAFVAKVLPWARVRLVVPLMVTAFYLFLAGPLPSLVRAAAMLLAAVISRALDRPSSGLDLLGLAGSAVLVLEPGMLFDASFQLSFCAVLGMVTAGTAVSDRMSRFVPRSIATSVSAAVGAQVAVSPILLAVYGSFQPVGLVSGLLIAPCASALLFAGLADLALPLWLPPVVHGAIGSALYAAYRVLEGVLEFFARFPPSRSWLLVGVLWAGCGAVLLARPVLRRRGSR